LIVFLFDIVRPDRSVIIKWYYLIFLTRLKAY
jgi:hypothetical protein